MDVNTLLSPTALTVAGAAAGTIASAPGTRSAWYRRLRKPCFQPPAAVFPVVWTGLYGSVIGASAAAALCGVDGVRHRALRGDPARANPHA